MFKKEKNILVLINKNTQLQKKYWLEKSNRTLKFLYHYFSKHVLHFQIYNFNSSTSDSDVMPHDCLLCHIIPIYIHILTVLHHMISSLTYTSHIFNHMPSILYHMISTGSGMSIQTRLGNKYVFITSFKCIGKLSVFRKRTLIYPK